MRRVGKRSRDTIGRLPAVPVKQRAADDIEVLVTFPDGTAELHYYRPGQVEWLTARYADPINETGQPWQVTITSGNRENGATG